MLQLLVLGLFVHHFGYHWSWYIFGAVLWAFDHLLGAAQIQGALRHVLKTWPGIRGLVE